ncbi:peroxisomal acyl-coenzyme A oxidase 1-like [Glandiceps talaboti]
MNVDIQRERRQATFVAEDLTYVLDGGKQKTKKRRFIESLALNDPELKCDEPSFMTRNERLNSSTKHVILIEKKMRRHNFQSDEDRTMFRMAAARKKDTISLPVHYLMFKPTMIGQGTEEQQKKWMPLMEDLVVTGTYAQTELGHGTFIRGLETTATYDPQTEEFVMHSPTLTSMKWWPGNLGLQSNHAVVVAQLYTKGQCHGIHQFMVQLRSLEDHRPLPGVTVGDIGPKMENHGYCNGFLRFDHVRIPRENMLMKYAKVQPDGTYIKPQSMKLAYGSMVLLRVNFTRTAAECLAMASTIAIRYSTVRRQTEITPGGEEPQILDYQSQQYKLFPRLASAYAFYFVGKIVKDIFLKTQDEIKAGNIRSMSALHAISSGLKSFTSDEMNRGIEICRLSCGGHGYSQASGLPSLYGRSTALCTVEGENTVLYLQVARYLMKCASMVATGQELPDLVSYLSKTPEKKWSAKNEADVMNQGLSAYEHRAQRLVIAAAQSLQREIGAGKAQHEAWNNSHIALIKAAQAHCHYFVVKSFVDFLRSGSLDTTAAVKSVLISLCQLYSLHGIHENAGDFLQDGYVSGEQMAMVTSQIPVVLATIRPNAVALVDAFDFRDEFLGSVLGRYDGNVYEKMYEWAKESPLNKEEVHESYYKYLKPMLQSSKSKL